MDTRPWELPEDIRRPSYHFAVLVQYVSDLKQPGFNLHEQYTIARNSTGEFRKSEFEAQILHMKKRVHFQKSFKPRF